MTLLKQSLPLLRPWASKRLERVYVWTTDCVSMTETELLCAEQQDRRTVDLILRKANYRSLGESDCWHAGVGTLIPECRQWWTAGEQMGRQVWRAKTMAWNKPCLSSGQTHLSRIGAAVPRKSICSSLPSSLSRQPVSQHSCMPTISASWSCSFVLCSSQNKRFRILCTS